MENKKFILSYDPIASSFSKSRQNMKWEEISYFIDNYMKTESFSVLDIGCGSGRLLNQLGEKFSLDNIKYLGVDFSAEMILEAKKNFPLQNFQVLEMEHIDEITGKDFDYVFFVASFHHKRFLSQRIQTMKNLYAILDKGARVFLTNWALDSDFNYYKYKDSRVQLSRGDYNSEDQYKEKLEEKELGGSDYSIKLGIHYRYYHCFSLEELEFIFNQAGFTIIENRLFDSQRNFISVLQK